MAENQGPSESLNKGFIYRPPVEGEPRHEDQPTPTWQERVQVRGNITKNEVNAYIHVPAPDMNDLTGVKPFADRHEQAAAFANPLYKSSEAYRNEVARRMLVSAR